MSRENMTPEELDNWLSGQPGKWVLGATVMYPQDRYPMLVSRVGRAGRTIWLMRVESVSATTGHSPARFEGPFPVWDHEYTDEELVRLGKPSIDAKVARWSDKDNCYKMSGTPVTVGRARLYRNYSY